MKHLSILIISLFIVTFQGNAQDSFIPKKATSEVMTSSLTVEINGLDSDIGTLRIAIYGSEGNWLSKSQFGQSSAIVNGKATVVFEDIPFGTYGISTFHDENNDKKLDTNLFGIPSEPYASSRGAKGRFGPPQWSDAKFDVTDSTHKEEIKY